MTLSKFELEQQLCLLSRDEVSHWLHLRGRPWAIDQHFKNYVVAHIDGIVKRAETMACKLERDSVSKLKFFWSRL